MKYPIVSALVLASLPALALAGPPRYERGNRHAYRGNDKSRYNVSIGFGYGGYSDSGFVGFDYGRGYGCAPRPYCPPPVVYRPVCPPPVIYYAPPIFYRPVYYYGAGWGCGW